MQTKAKFGKFRPKLLQQLGDIVVQHDRGRGNAQLRRSVLTELFSDDLYVVEERLNELEQFHARRRKREWSSLKQLCAERLLEPGDLAAHCRLLDAVWDVAYCGCDSAVFCDEIKQLQVMNVHDRKRR